MGTGRALRGQKSMIDVRRPVAVSQSVTPQFQLMAWAQVDHPPNWDHPACVRRGAIIASWDARALSTACKRVWFQKGLRPRIRFT